MIKRAMSELGRAVRETGQMIDRIGEKQTRVQE